MAVGFGQTTVHRIQVLLSAKLYCFFLLVQLMLTAFLFIVPMFRLGVTVPSCNDPYRVTPDVLFTFSTPPLLLQSSSQVPPYLSQTRCWLVITVLVFTVNFSSTLQSNCAQGIASILKNCGNILANTKVQENQNWKEITTRK